ncbi:MAG: hypothetical protein AAFV88_05425, partial [Planctomycetota bacterium]
METLEARQMLAGDLDSSYELPPSIQDRLIATLAPLPAAADSVDANPELQSVLPAFGRSINQLIGHEGGGIGDLLRLRDPVVSYLGRFDPNSEFFDSDLAGELPSAQGIIDSLSASLPFSLPLVIEGGYDETDETLQFHFSLDATTAITTDLNFDVFGDDWSELGVRFDPSSAIDLSLTTDLDYSVVVSLGGGIDRFAIDSFRIEPSASVAPGTELDASVGPIDVTVSVSELEVDGGIELTLPAGAAELADRIQIQVVPPDGQMLDVDLTVDSSLFGSASVTATDVDLFASPAAAIDITPLAMNFPADALINGLLTLADRLDAAVADGEVGETAIPLVNQTAAELLGGEAEPLRFSAASVTAITDVQQVDGFNQFSVTLETGSQPVGWLGISPGNTASFLATTGETFPAEVASVAENVVTLRYAVERSDRPEVSDPALSFNVGGSLGDRLRAVLGNYGAGDTALPSIGEVIRDLSGPLGIDLGQLSFDEATSVLTMTPSFSPEPIQFRRRFDFGDAVEGLEFAASGDFLIQASPSVRLPLRIDLNPESAIDAADRVALVEDIDPEVTVAVTAALDDPAARATLGFLDVVLREDGNVAPNNGVALTTNLSIDLNDPGTGAAADGVITIAELAEAGNLSETFETDVDGSLAIDGIEITPEVAGAAIPGRVEIFTTAADGSRGSATFSDFSSLGSLLDQVSFNNTIGSFDSLTPDAVATMIIQLGSSLQEVVEDFEVPDGIPFVDDAIGEVVKFIDTTGDFARQLYFSASLVGDADITVTDGRLSADALLTVRVEGSEPHFITVSALATDDNVSIDDLYIDINAAFEAAGLGGYLIAERLTPLTGTDVTAVLDISGDAVGPGVAPLPSGMARFEFDVSSSVDPYTITLKVGDVVRYLDTAGDWRSAEVDELTREGIRVRFDTNQTAPETGANRGIGLYGPELENRLAIRTSDPTVGVSIDVSTVAVTAARELPSLLSQDLPLSVTFAPLDSAFSEDPVEVTVPATSTNGNLTAADMAVSLNDAFRSAGIGERLTARVVGEFLQLAVLDSTVGDVTIRGGEILGLEAEQSRDRNIARDELGLSPGQTGQAEFRAGTIQGLVRTLNGLIANQFGDSGLPFDAELTYIEPPVDQPDAAGSVQFKLSLGDEFRRQVELDFDEGLDLGFAQLGVAGGGVGELIASAGVDLTVGLDLQPPGSSTEIDDTTLLGSLDEGRGTAVAVAMTGTTIPSAGRPATSSDVTLALEISQLGDGDSAAAPDSALLSVTVNAATLADNTSVDDLAADLNLLLANVFDASGSGFAGPSSNLVAIDGIVPIEVQVDNGRLVIVSNDRSINGLSIAADTSAFLGFTVGQVGDVDDLRIELANGEEVFVNLDFAETIGDVRDKIVLAGTTAGFVERLQVRYEGDRILIRDTTVPTGNNVFRITALNGVAGLSGIGATLRILKSAADDVSTDGVDERFLGGEVSGDPIFQGDRIDQFYVVPSASRVYANVVVSASDINLVGSLGILDVGIIDGNADFRIEGAV